MAKVEGSIRGFSIEGYFAERATDRPKEQIEEDLSAEIEAGLKLLEIKQSIVKAQL